MNPHAPSIFLSRKALACIIGAFVIAIACQPAAADEIWGTNVGPIFYQRDIGGWAIWRFGSPHPRGEIYIKGLGGVLHHRGGYRGYWIESRSHWTELHGKLCKTAMKGVDGRSSRYWGTIDIKFIDPQYPSRWIGRAGNCHGPRTTTIKANPRVAGNKAPAVQPRLGSFFGHNKFVPRLGQKLSGSQKGLAVQRQKGTQIVPSTQKVQPQNAKKSFGHPAEKRQSASKIFGIGPMRPAPANNILGSHNRPAFRGNDATKFFGNNTLQHNFINRLPQPKVRAYYVELNQAIQNMLFPVPRVGTSSEVVSLVPFLPQKPLVVRYYLLAAGRKTNFSVGPTLKVALANGQTFELRPDTDQTSVMVPADPGGARVSLRGRVTNPRNDLFRTMRADTSRTLNYVIPGGDLPQNAGWVRLTLEGFTGTVTTRLPRGPVLGLNIVPLDIDTDFERGSGVPLATHAKIRSNMLQFLRAAYPISGVNVVWQPPFALLPDTNWLGLFREAYLDRGSMPVPGATWSTIVGIGRRISGGGVAYCPGYPAIAGLSGNVPAQEIGHNLDLNHIASVHNRTDNEPTPYPHGAIGAFDVSSSPQKHVPGTWGNVGVAVQLNVDEARGREWWSIKLILAGDPATPGAHVHEFMSYGYPEAHPGTRLNPMVFRIQGGNGEWISDVIYDRIYNHMFAYGPVASFVHAPCGPPDASSGRSAPAAAAPEPTKSSAKIARAGGEQRVDALVFTAKFKGGQFGDLRLLRKSISRSLVQDTKTQAGPFRVELRDRRGHLLASRSFRLRRGSFKGAAAMVVFPVVDQIARLVVQRNGTVLAAKKASPSAPRVRILSPRGGEALSSGALDIRWQVSDSDGHNYPGVYVEYSPDGGVNWQPLALFPPGNKPRPDALGVDIKSLAAGRKGIIRISATDGINTAVVQTDRFFSIRGPRKQ